MNTCCIPDSEQERLHRLFPGIVELGEMGPAHGYQQLAISVFDHQLDAEEATLLLHGVSPEKQSERNARMQWFMDSLLRETEVITFRYRLEDPNDPALTFAAFPSTDAAHYYFQHTSNQRYVAVCPEYRAVVYEGYDDTNQMFYFDFDQVGRVIELAKEAGLHVW